MLTPEEALARLRVHHAAEVFGRNRADLLVLTSQGDDVALSILSKRMFESEAQLDRAEALLGALLARQSRSRRVRSS
jgi:hypothetical protein